MGRKIRCKRPKRSLSKSIDDMAVVDTTAAVPVDAGIDRPGDAQIEENLQLCIRNVMVSVGLAEEDVEKEENRDIDKGKSGEWNEVGQGIVERPKKRKVQEVNPLPAQKSKTTTKAKKTELAKRGCEAVFFLYRGEKFYEMKKSDPNLKLTKDVVSEISASWNSLGVEGQKSWKDRAGNLKEENMQSMSKGLMVVKKKDAIKATNTSSNGFKSSMSLGQVGNVLKALNADQKQVVRDIGLGGLLELKCTYIPKPMAEWILKNFDPQSCSLSAHGQTFQLDVNEVGRLLGIERKGEVPRIDSTTTEVQKMFLSLGLKEGPSGVAPFLKYFEGVGERESGDEFKRNIVLLMMSMLGLPSCRAGIRPTLVNLVMDVSKLNTINWAKLILDYLMQSLEKYKRGKQKHVAGCFLILLVFYLDKFIPYGAPLPRGFHDHSTVSRIRFWGNREINDRWNFIEANKMLNPPKKIRMLEQDDEAENSSQVSLSRVMKELCKINGVLRDVTDRLTRIEERMEEREAKQRKKRRRLARDNEEEKTDDEVEEEKKEESEEEESDEEHENEKSDEEEDADESDDEDEKEKRDEDEKKEEDDQREGDEEEDGEDEEEDGDDSSDGDDDESGKEKERTTEMIADVAAEDPKRTVEEVAKDDRAEGNAKCVVEDATVEGGERGDLNPSFEGAAVEGLEADHISITPPQPQKVWVEKSFQTPSRIESVGSVMAEKNDHAACPSIIQVSDHPTCPRRPKCAKNATPLNSHIKMEEASEVTSPSMNLRKSKERRLGKQAWTPYTTGLPKVGAKRKKAMKPLKNATKLRKGVSQVDSNVVSFRELSEHEKVVVDYAFDEKLDKDEYLVAIKNMTWISHEVFGSLRLNLWLNDSVLDVVAAKCNIKYNRDGTYWYLPPWFSAHRVTRCPKGYVGDVTKVKKIIMPMNEPNAHWYAGCVDIDKKCIYVFDSLRSKARRIACENHMSKAVCRLHDLLTLKFGGTYVHNISRFPVSTPDWVPQQQNGFDCGIFVCIFMEYLHQMKGVIFNFTSKQSRESLAVRLLLEPPNEFCKTMKRHCRARLKCNKECKYKVQEKN